MNEDALMKAERGERQVVAVSWSMPPALFPRSIQVARLLKGLRGHGWNSSVVTLADRTRSPEDPRDPALADLYAGAYELYPVQYRQATEQPWNLRFRWRHGALAPADAQWAVDAAAAAEEVQWRRRAAVLVTFAQPWRDHFVGLMIRRPRLPWVAHFSDPWVDSLYYDPTKAGAGEAAIERAIMERADLVVFTNSYAADLVMRKYPDTWRGKVRVVNHAFDPDIWSSVHGRVVLAPERPALRLGYVGALLAAHRTGADLFAALSQLQSTMELRGRITVRVTGAGSGSPEAQQAVTRLGLGALVTFDPPVSYLESLAAMAASDALLLLDAAAPVNVFFPSKLVEYLGARRPIVGVTPPEGASAELLRTCGFPVVAPGDVAGLARVIRDLIERHERGEALPAAPADVLEGYSLPNISRTFSRILEEAAACSSWAHRWS